MTPSFTIIVTGYNQTHSIRDALVSVLEQDYDGEIEYIFSDDCSTDNTFEIMKEVASTYSGPHPIILNRNEQNLNIGKHIEKLYEMARHPWVIRMDGDDISLPWRCRAIAETILRFPKARYIVSDLYNVIIDNGNNKHIPDNITEMPVNAEICDDTTPGHYFRGSTSAILKQARLGASELNLGEDALEAQHAWLNDGLICIKNKLIVYYCHNDNASHIDKKERNRNVRSFYQGMEKFRRILENDIIAHQKILALSQAYLDDHPSLDQRKREKIAYNIEQRQKYIDYETMLKTWPDMNLREKLRHRSYFRKYFLQLLPFSLYARLIVLKEKLIPSH